MCVRVGACARCIAARLVKVYRRALLSSPRSLPSSGPENFLTRSPTNQYFSTAVYWPV